MRVDLAARAVLESDIQFQVHILGAAVERLDHRAVFFGDEGTAQLAGARYLVVVRVKILGQQQEPLYPRLPGYPY